MTKAQERKVELIRQTAEQDLFFGGPDKYEFKEWKVEELNYGTVSLLLEVGRKNDEGTLASIFCRDRAHLFIGPRGGITYYNNKCTRCRYRSLFRAVLDQR